MSKKNEIKSWDLFFSYNCGTNGLNKEKVKNIHDKIKQKFPQFEICWEKNINLDEQNIREGVQKSTLFISFITSDYTMNKNCMAELALAWCYDKPILFYINEDTKGKSEKEIEEHILKDTAFYSSACLYHTSADKLIEAIDLNLSNYSCIKTLLGHLESVNCMLMINSKMLASGSSDNTIKLWNLETYETVVTLDAHKEAVNCVQKISERFLASGSKDKTIKIWNLKDYACVRILEGHEFSVCFVLLVDSDLLASSSVDKTIKIWDLNEYTCVRTIDAHENDICFMQLIN